MEADAEAGKRAGRPEPFTPDNRLTFSKVDAEYKSGNRDAGHDPVPPDAPSRIAPEVAAFYARLCPAGVYEAVEGGLKVNAPNCVDCKATDVLGPRWTPREGGSGPKYKLM